LNAVRGAQEDGLKIEFNVLSGVTHSQIMTLLPHSDFVIDQVYADTAAGVFAAEASMLGIPTIIATYDPSWLTDVLKEFSPPTCLVKTSQVEQEINRLATDSDYRNYKGVMSQKHFERLWNPENVVRSYLQILYPFGKSPKSINPLTLVDVRGGYAELQKIVNTVNCYIQEHGTNALELSHNPVLKEALILFGTRAKSKCN